MKSLKPALVLLGMLLSVSAQAQVVDSGSTGVDGAFTVVDLPFQFPSGTTVQCAGTITFPHPPCTVTVPLREPPNHVFNFTTVTIGPQVTVKFKPNRANTPVFILARGDVRIDGQIDVSGEDANSGSLIGTKGGPGGFGGGRGVPPGGPVDVQGGSGLGPNGGAGGTDRGFGVFDSPGFGCHADCYGAPDLQPLIGGSGGGADAASFFAPIAQGHGGGGGGALLIASSGAIDLGVGNDVALSAAGGRGWGGRGTGSGGAVRLVANVLRGTRQIIAETDPGNLFPPGRIRLETPPTGFQYAGMVSPVPSLAQPGPIFPPVMPVLRIVSVGATPLPSQPFADPDFPDILIAPDSFGVPQSVVVEATHVPAGTEVRIIVRPQYAGGPAFVVPDRSQPGQVLVGPLTCLTDPTQQCMRATITVAFPPSGVGVISAIIDAVTPVR